MILEKLRFLVIAECKIYGENKVKIQLQKDAPNDFYANIAPIRMISLKSSAKSDATESIMQLPDHAQDRMQSAKSEWNMIEMEVVEFLRNRCFLKNQLSEEELYKYAGIFMVNGATIGSSKGTCYGKALYSVFSVMNHDCISNAKFKINTLSWEVAVKAQTNIKKGEEITVQYISTILGTHKRRRRLKSKSQKWHQ